MDFKIVKRLLRKNLLWMGAIIFFLIGLVLIITLSLPLSNQNKIIYSTLLSVNFLFIYFIAFILSKSKTSVSTFTEVHSEVDLESKTGEITVTNSHYLHYFIIFVCILMFFIQVTSGGVFILRVSFWTYFKNKWWIFFITMIINIIFLYLFANINIYLLNNSVEFKEAYLQSYFATKEQNDKNEDKK